MVKRGKPLEGANFGCENAMSVFHFLIQGEVYLFILTYANKCNIARIIVLHRVLRSCCMNDIRIHDNGKYIMKRRSLSK